MIKFNEDFVKNLPDTYQKQTDSNNDKLLKIAKMSSDTLKTDILDVLNSLDIEQATGKTLDLYGEIVNQPRKSNNDIKYRINILAKIIRNVTDGDFDSIINAVSMSFNCDPSEVQIQNGSEAGTIDLLAIPLQTVESAELSQGEIVEIVKQLLPVGISLNTFLFSGTFEFADSENVADTDKGFANDTQTIGGYFGNIAV
ncbi:hypothetical protein [Ruminococcus sp.]|uniref:hypothetical protein n=1 Tax=Ruminococcus sp. TaxID=41978 RepID=UPI00261F2265|nr:hypothetical protein [Ruminococcus sp.]MDD6988782.1 hypothetical protein [Ruminococcus sp.]